jgi:hypothetical protein
MRVCSMRGSWMFMSLTQMMLLQLQAPRSCAPTVARCHRRNARSNAGDAARQRPLQHLKRGACSTADFVPQ